MMRLFFILTLVISSAAFAKDKKCENFDRYTDVNMTEMQKLVTDSKATIIDVNTEESYAKSHIPNSIHFASNKENFAKVLPEDKNQLIVAYCGGKMCTAWKQAAQKACELGYKNIKHFSEGITGWDKSKKG
jgi:rhodanese-related sulfurtransferase